MPNSEPSAEYDLNIHDGEVLTVFRMKDSGIRLVGDRIAWTIDGQPYEAALAKIAAIRLTTEVETLKGPIGATACQIRFYGGGAVTVFGGNSRSPDQSERLRRYRAFVTDLHRRLDPKARARTRFTAGFGGARFGILLAAAALITVFLIVAVIGFLFLGSGKLRAVIAIGLGVIMTAGWFKLLSLNAPHVYDPTDPLGSATAGSIGDTLSHAVAEIRSGMTPGRRLGVSAVGLGVVAIVVLVIASHQTVSLFQGRRALSAFQATVAQAGRLTAVQVTVTPDALVIETMKPGGSSAHILWHASRRTLLGATEWDHVSGPVGNYNTAVGDPDEPFALQPGDFAHIDSLASAAIERASLGDGARVTRMMLSAASPFVHPEPPRWTVEVTGPQSSAELFAERNGMLYPATPAPAGPPRIIIGAATESWMPLSDTWIRITNPSRAIVFDGVLKPGQNSYTAPNIPGLMLRTGHASSLVISVDGHVAPSINGGRHDIALDPDALIAGTAIRD